MGQVKNGLSPDKCLFFSSIPEVADPFRVFWRLKILPSDLAIPIHWNVSPHHSRLFSLAGSS